MIKLEKASLKLPCRNSIRFSYLTLVFSALVTVLTTAQPAHALFFGYNQQAEAYKQQGEAAQEAQNYDMAVNYFTSAINCLPYDAAQNLADLYYVRAIATDATGQYDRATRDWQASHDNYQKCVDQAQYNPGTNVAYDKQYADDLQRMLNWRSTENPNTPNYMECGPMKRFAAPSSVKVYVDTTEQAGFSYDLRYLIFQAMNQWCSFSGSPIRMEQWSTADGANIIVQRANAPGQIGFGAGGQTNNQDSVNAAGQDIMTKSFVRLTSPGYNGNSMSQVDKNKLYNLALHETGHALGIGGHSPSGLDAMYFKAPVLKLSDRDKATMRMMYQ